MGVGKNSRQRFESFDVVTNINVTEPDVRQSTSTAEENKNGSIALAYSENSERKGKDKRLIHEEDEDDMENMMDQMLSAEESDRLNKLETNHEWKRTMKRIAGNVNQFANDICTYCEPFSQSEAHARCRLAIWRSHRLAHCHR